MMFKDVKRGKFLSRNVGVYEGKGKGKCVAYMFQTTFSFIKILLSSVLLTEYVANVMVLYKYWMWPEYVRGSSIGECTKFWNENLNILNHCKL